MAALVAAGFLLICILLAFVCISLWRAVVCGLDETRGMLKDVKEQLEHCQLLNEASSRICDQVSKLYDELERREGEA